MNKLPTSTSFQGVLDSIIRSYLLNELPPEGSENDNTRHHIAERDLGTHLLNPQIFSGRVQGESEVNNNAGPVPGTSAAVGAQAAQNLSFVNPVDHEYIKAIYQCFEKRGVFKELQTFLRHKLVSILQDEWPNLQKPVAARQKEEPNTIVYRLVDDFLRCHNLLYTLSVLSSESDVKLPCTRVLYGKLNSKEAEDLLDDLGIKRNSRLSGQVLKCYFDKENFSLLESMHYLGIWLDDSSIMLDNLQQENAGTNKQCAKRKGSGCGESIVLSHAKQNKDKILEHPSTCPYQNKKEKGESGSIVGVEQRLLELEKNLEREKEFKIKEGIEKYKKDELAKLREELETKFQLQLIDKDREHFVDVQKRIDEMNINMQKERQQWLEGKLHQEKELCELRKQLSEIVNASGDGLMRNPAQLQTISIGEQQSTTKVIHMATKTCQVTLNDDSVVHKCSCKKRCSCQNGRESSSACRQAAVRNHLVFHPVEQDRLAFLQYRMEQQDEEIKSLRMKLLMPSNTYTRNRLLPERPDGNANGNMDDYEGNSVQSERKNTNFPPRRPDNLDSFLSESRRRVEILDTAVDRVDEIVQELFAKRRAPLSSELSARLLAEAVKKKKPPASIYIPFPMPVPPTTSLLSPMNFPSAVPLVHQQVPEKQAAFTPTSAFHSTPANYNNSIYSQNSGLLTFIKHPPLPPLESSSLRPVDSILESPVINSEVQNRPETPADKLFSVAYEEPVATRQKRKKEESPSVKNLKSQDNGQSSPSVNVSRGPEPDEELEQSLFHMAIRNVDGENRKTNEEKNVKKTLEEKAIRNGALSREKISSSDEGENSISLSISLSGHLKQPARTFSSRQNGSNGSGPKAISKSKVTEITDKFPLKTNGNNGRNIGEPRQSFSSQHGKLVKSSSSSSSKKSLSIIQAECKIRTSPDQVQTRNDHGQAASSEQDDESSINISVPHSLAGDDNVEDFWQL